ncbi:phage tail protein [Providencia rettgeri]|uniref:phage tail-collar fiber domain-containing protein n=1 Tax=Providencia rettgeri TaxID=587 RepID=UPI002882B6FA|nr:phage tail protein [Providencia rettgeri]ELM3936160.1 phage tail protein [Providencia rettgeri]EMA4643911.1 phage tail protein [Providencia rettgeri]MDK3107691.1 phage tail protein [Providencia rettgeri]WRR95383.1 phage tail protein [Providencia rettgeri]
MKYFALLTKLGENLLAQATALGTKLELTHMAVGDGGGSLPTPDTNQTKLIAEKRRAAINTLFIDDKNKNQIIAEQIIPEQDGGWWIREIGLFDKAGNLIAVANCPETYKPQLVEGSGRTQSIRMVLIVSHTESVTLKIDPSVVLATREYVNTEITVLDKKIDALSAQTKLDLNKKFDKANISGQKGNHNDKVPSLNLFTTEIAKLAVIGYSYSKIESDGRCQPKGNYAPAGDYATNTALNNGLNGKFDKAGGEISNNVWVNGKVSAKNEFAVRNDKVQGAAIVTQLTDDGILRVRTQRNGVWSEHNLPTSTGTLMQVGDFGWGATIKEDAIKETDFGINKRRTFGVFYHDSDAKNTPNGHSYGGGIFFGRDPAVSTHMLYSPDWSNRLYMRSSKSASTMNDWAEFYSTEIAKSDRNGHLKRTNFPDELSDYPVGAPIPWPQATAPAGFLVCNGQSFNKTTYPLLAKAYPTGVLPDLRGEFIRGVDYGRGIDANRTVLSAQGDAFRAHNHSVIGEDSGSGTAYFGRGNGNRRAISKDAMNLEGGTETRPRNIAFLYIVRAA